MRYFFIIVHETFKIWLQYINFLFCGSQQQQQQQYQLDVKTDFFNGHLVEVMYLR